MRHVKEDRIVNAYNRILGMGVLGCVLLFWGCQKPPQAEVDALKQVAAGAAAEAQTYAGEAWANADQAVQAVDAEIAVQAEKFALTRSYKRTSELIAAANQAVTSAVAEAQAAHEQARNDAQEALDALSAQIAANEQMLADLGACRRKPKGFAADLEALSGGMNALTSQMQEADGLLAADQPLDAMAAAETALGQAQTLGNDLQNAKTRLGC